MIHEISVYPYKELKNSPKESLLFSAIKDYELCVPCLNKDEEISYIFRSYCFRSYLYITDIFPAMWDGRADCFKRITSREGYSVNMRKLSITCVYIFVKHYISTNINNAMVISGSYGHGEDETKVSRKLKLYWAFFSPILEILCLQATQIPELNAFVLTDRNSPIDGLKIASDYRDFKLNKK